jgi:Fe-S oxidoreductase
MESYSCGGRLWLARAWLEDRLPWSDHLADILYACTTCKNCVVKCPLRFNVDIVNMVVAARGEMIERGKVPAGVKTFLENVELHGNPYGNSRNSRGNWADGLGLEPYNGHDFLLYIGCTGSYDTRAQQAARALAEVLGRAGVSFGILGNEENCDGNEVHNLGEMGLYEMLADQNIAAFRKLGVRKVITLSPHAFNIMKNRYPEQGGSFEMFHYTQILSRISSAAKLELNEEAAKVTYHDPCFLGRWNDEYETPRKILKSIPGVELVEMEKTKKSAVCCGGGGGNFCIDLLGGSEDSPARRRAREAQRTGAAILAVACPKCLVMLEDAVKAEGLEERLIVRDIAEIIRNACG